MFWIQKISKRSLVYFLALGVIFSFYSDQASAYDAKASYKAQCAGCHSIGGGRLVGPDLKGITEKRSRDWLIKFIVSPQSVIDSGDKVANDLLAEYNGMVMPALGLSESEASQILDFISGGKAAPAPKGKAASTDEVVVATGKALFEGTKRFKNQGPQCLSCHSAGSAGIFGGGNLGPDLTKAFEKFGDAGLGGSLTSISFPTMIGPYKGKALTEDEVFQVKSYLAYVSKNEKSGQGPDNFILFSVIGLVIMLFLIDLIWKNRRKKTSRK